MRPNFGARALLIAGTTFLSACSETTALPVTDLATARELWSQNEPRSYEFTFEKACFCAGLNGPLVVSVRHGVVQSVRNVRTGRAVEEPWDNHIVLVEALFDRIETAQANGAYVQSEYDRERGHPKAVLIDWLPGAADDEVWYNISGLRATRPGSSEFLDQRNKLPY